jgi:hypothetical protein
MIRKRLEALLFGIIGALIVQIGIAATSNQYTVPTNSPPWLNTALEVTQSISANVTATTMTQASIPNTYTSYGSNYFDFSGPFLQNGNGLQIGNSLTTLGYSAGVFVNEPSGMNSPLLLLSYNNGLKFTVDYTGNVIAANNISGSSIGGSNTPITGSTGMFNKTLTLNSLSATNITSLIVPYSSPSTHSIQIGTNSMSVANPSAALFISIPSTASNIPLAISDKNGSSLFTVDTNGNISAAGNVSGSTIGASNVPITGSTLTLSATNITSLIVPFPITKYPYVQGIRVGNYVPGNTSGIVISAPSANYWPFAYYLPTSDINGAMHIDQHGSIYSTGDVSAVNGTFSSNVSANSLTLTEGNNKFNSFQIGVSLSGWVSDLLINKPSTSGAAILTLALDGDKKFYVDPKGDTTINGTLNGSTGSFSGDISTSGKISAVNGSFSGNVTAANYGAVNGSTGSFSGDISTSGKISAVNGSFSGNVTAANYGAVNGSTGSFSGDISTSGKISAVNGSFSGNVTAANYGAVNGNTGSFSGDISTSGKISAVNGSFSGYVTINGTGGNTLHSCYSRSSVTSNNKSYCDISCDSNDDVAVGGGGICSGSLLASYPEDSHTWYADCTMSGCTAIVVCCKK